MVTQHSILRAQIFGISQIARQGDLRVGRTAQSSHDHSDVVNFLRQLLRRRLGSALQTYALSGSVI